MNPRRLDGKVAIVTGAGRGIGRMEAHCLARAGAKLVVSDFGVDAGGTSTADIVAQEIRALGDEAVSSSEDLMQQRGPTQVVATALRCFGGLDILVNNAGLRGGNPIHKMTEEQWDSVLDSHLKASFLMIREAAPHMRTRGGGVIINISSGASKIPPERYRTNPVAPYASTKYALNAITLIGRQQLAADNISLGLVYPGVTATNFFNTLLEGRQPASTPGGATDVDSPESVAEKILEAVETQAAEVYTENLKQALSSSTLRA